MEIVDGEVHWYAFAHGQRVAERTSTGDVVWYVQDHLGSTRLILLETETKQTDLDYTPWGMATATWGSTSDTQYRFNGNTEDVDGVVYYEARSYAVRWGAMMSADTVSPSYVRLGSLNRYAYAENNPVTLVDPTGHAVAKSAAGQTDYEGLHAANAQVAADAASEARDRADAAGIAASSMAGDGHGSMQSALDHWAMRQLNMEAILDDVQAMIDAGMTYSEAYGKYATKDGMDEHQFKTLMDAMWKASDPDKKESERNEVKALVAIDIHTGEIAAFGSDGKKGFHVAKDGPANAHMTGGYGVTMPGYFALTQVHTHPWNQKPGDLDRSNLDAHISGNPINKQPRSYLVIAGDAGVWHGMLGAKDYTRIGSLQDYGIGVR